MESIRKVVEKRSKFRTNGGWVQPVSRKRSRRTAILEVLRNNLRDYCDSSSLAGYRYLVEQGRSWNERLIWIVLHATTVCMLGLLVNSAYQEYVNVPVITVVDSDNYPPHHLKYPGIAICNINRISRKAAIALANDIVSANVTSMEFLDVLNFIRQFGALYDIGTEPNTTSKNYLNQLLIKYYAGDYDVTSIMKNLSPNCTEGFSSCHFQGVRKDCSKILVFRKTQDGFCCTFNYAREFDDIPILHGPKRDTPYRPYYINRLGITNGLSLVMEPFVEDYYFPMLPIIGWKVTVFSAEDYPDSGSGAVSEALLSPATETFVELDVTSFYSTNDIRDVSEKDRQCIFEDEISITYADYSYSDCLVECRAMAVWNMCKCRPFYLPRRGIEQYGRKVCDLGDIECLHANRDIIWKVLSGRAHGEGEQIDKARNSEVSKHCDQCLPSCNDVRYYLRSSTSFLDKRLYKTELLENVQVENQSVVHIYFTKQGSVRLKQEVAYYWYELLSNVGGICGVFIGFSLISVVEFLYFTLCIIHELCCGRGETRATKSKMTGTTRGTGTERMWKEKVVNAKRFDGMLYWNEFLAHRSVTLQKGKIQRLQVRKY